MDSSFWRNKRVLVTGNTGFKGSWLTLWLKMLDANVTGFALSPPTKINLFELANISRDGTWVFGDVRDFDTFKKTLDQIKPEIIFHLAAQTVVQESYEDPLNTYSTNVMGTANLLEAVRQLALKCAIVVVTSDKCYENKEWLWGYRETDRMGGYDPYSNSKACAELVTSTFRRSYFLNSNEDLNVNVASARSGNVIGGGDWTKYQLIPEIISAFIEKKPAQIRNPKAIRPWQFVL